MNVTTIAWLLATSTFAQDPDLFSPDTVRDFHLEFSQANWQSQLEAHIADEQDILGDLSVDDVLYLDVGVRYKGNSSLNVFGDKKPFNLTLDAVNEDQNLYGFETLNLNNGYMDPTMVREAITLETARRYLPAPRSAFANLYINDEITGLYGLVEQVNKDFLRSWFDARGGNLYKGDAIEGDPLGRSTLVWLGSDPEPYAERYELKTDDSEEPWTDLVYLIDVLNNTPEDAFEEAIQEVLDVDGVLWYLALSNLYVNLDSYAGSGHNYYIYHDPTDDRFHVVLWDVNESFGVFSSVGDGMPLSLGQLETLSPLYGETASDRPLVRNLLNVPAFRRRYLAHFRTLLEEEFTVENVQSLAEQYQSLIRDDLADDPNRLYSMQLFEQNITETVIEGHGPMGRSIPGILSLVENRRAYLLTVEELTSPLPAIHSVMAWPENPPTSDEVVVSAEVGGSVPVSSLRLYYSFGDRFVSVEMFDDGLHGDGKTQDLVYAATIPPAPGGTLVRYYIEAEGAGDPISVVYSPEGAERSVYSYSVSIPDSERSDVVINELAASNESVIQDPQGDYDDWIELRNITSSDLDLSGMYLSDKEDNPRKWQIPDGTMLAAGGYLLVWADKDGSDEPGLHASFKLAKSGETLYLVDTDERDNALVDSVTFPAQTEDMSYGRFPDGVAYFQEMVPTPGAPNAGASSESNFVRGEANGDGEINLTDAVTILNELFLGQSQAIPCDDAQDVNDDGQRNLTDAISLLTYLFLSGDAPPEPFPSCGLDLTDDSLTCEEAEICKGE